MSIRIYVGNLPKNEEVERQELENFFQDAGELLSVKVISDRKTGKCRGFGFVTVKSDEQADQLVEAYNGKSFRDSPVKIEKALPRKKGSKSEPTSKASSAPSRGRSSRSSGDSSSAQPDPRWADELSKLKQMLGSQATNS